MAISRVPFLLILFLCTGIKAYAQRTYASHSVLADGSCYKLAVTGPGVYKIDISLLNSMGINTLNLSSASVRLFGYGGAMLPEDNASPRFDDIPENAIYIHDGGDGTINGNDYILFYTSGNEAWQPNAQHFQHQSHLYADTAYYFLKIGGTGKRVVLDNGQPAAGKTITTYDFRAYTENDKVNVLGSGQRWLDEEMNANASSRNYPFTVPAGGLTNVFIRASVAAKSVGSSRFNILMNQSQVQALYPDPISGNVFETQVTSVNSLLPVTGTANSATVGVQFVPAGGAQGWVDFIELHGRAKLAAPSEGQMLFRDRQSVAAGSTGLFKLAGVNAQVWDVTNALEPVQVNASFSADTLRFIRDCSVLREYVAFQAASLPAPRFIGAVGNQDLHGETAPGMVIITAPELQAQAQRLAAYHQQRDGLSSLVVTPATIYNEFASGRQDPSAIRDFLKMCYDKGPAPKYLLLFGDASYDYKNRVTGNTNLVPTWQSPASADQINSYASDDFFGLLDDNDDVNTWSPISLLDIAIGRLPAKTPAEAGVMVDKIIGYHSPQAFGAWRNRMTFVADDEDGNLHLEDAETVSNIIVQESPQFGVQKIYADAYPQASLAGGTRYPAVNDAINAGMFNGTLVWNYTGHGSFLRLGEEVLLDESMMDTWNNEHRLPLMITATCDFAPFDNPAYTSLGEKMILREKGGAIALMTTTRAVFAYSNLVMNANYIRLAFAPDVDGNMPSLGRAAMLAKNFTYSSFTDVVNNRKFQLLGDPALTLAFPGLKVRADSINGVPVGATDTLKALGKYTFSGSVTNVDGQLAAGYNGDLEVTIYDKPEQLVTRGNDPGSSVTPFMQEHNILFKGRASVVNGRFSHTFVVPADIDYKPGTGRISYYTYNKQQDGAGFYNSVTISGAASSANDQQGPSLKAWMNDFSFTNGGLTGENAVLLIHLSDENGINTTGRGIGHDIVAILDDSSRYFVLNDFYEATKDDYRQGTIRYPISGLTEGTHTLTIRAWDTHNNSGTIQIRFTVRNSKALAVEKVGNYPNPVREETKFFFSHNQQNVDLDIVVRIFSLQGQLVRTLKHTINSSGGRYDGIIWNRRADSGVRVPHGIYVYELLIDNRQGKSKKFGGKLILL
ncbi:type IX secretion system sortase PorU [Chitinophaga horti]|uniref:Type IX secretion system sortase PorU n=1 Tax=Chitinophaga horti TaxID=2920382 RepID=A0ABY6J1R7_9BACT|nr:type IX secretion system sortase PorU [Chitinophaga horti]UYQ92291.1 type IX secretion system sortase PorU [Chitinophaga horti]